MANNRGQQFDLYRIGRLKKHFGNQLCLLVGLYLVEQKDCLIVGDWQTGYVIAPYGDYGDKLRAELDARCEQTGRVPAEWVRVFKMGVCIGGAGNSEMI